MDINYFMSRLYIISAIFVLIYIPIFILNMSYSDGERYGYITKLSNKGFVFKTWEGELFTQAKSTTGVQTTAIGTTFMFSVPNDLLVDKVKQAARNGTYVSLVYSEKVYSFPWQGDTKYHIVDVIEKIK